MTTFAGWVQSTYAMIKHPLRGQKYDLKRAREPVVHGFREPSSPRSKSPSSEIRLYTLGNRTAPEYCRERAAGNAPAVPRTSNRVMTAPSVVSNPTRTDGNRSWLHDSWKPGQVKAGIDFFERVTAASTQGAPARPASPTASIKVTRPTSPPPEPPKPAVLSRNGKKKRAPQPPQSVAVRAKTPTAPRGPDGSKPRPLPTAQTAVQSPVKKEVTSSAKTITPPPAPSMDGLKVLQRAYSAPPLSRPNMTSVFAELTSHKLVRRCDSAPETMGTAGEKSAPGGRKPFSMESRISREKPPLNNFQRELMKETTLREEAAPIEVKPEVQRQAEALRARRAAERNATQSIPSRWNAESNLRKPAQTHTYLSNGRLLPTTDQKSLIDELKTAQAVRESKTAHLPSG